MKILTPFRPDGPGWSSCEQYRHECEVRHIAHWRPLERRQFLEGVAHKRGQAAADRLVCDVAAHEVLAREIADMETNADRAARLREIEAERGKAFAQGIRESAWALMQERETC